MKITYLTKCPNCGGSIDEEFSKFCPFCGNSLAKNEPMSREERLKMYEYEDQTVPHKRIVINEKSNSSTMVAGITILVLGIMFIMLGIFFGIVSFALSMELGSFGYGTGNDILAGVISMAMMLAIFSGCGFVFAVLGIIFLIINGKRKRYYKRIPDNPDEVIEGMVRRFEVEKAGKQCNYYVYVRVENPKPMVLECQCFDLRIKDNLCPEQKVKIYRKGNEYSIVG